MLIEQRKSLRGEIHVPGDKSISHRAVFFSSLAKGKTEIDGFLFGEDCLSTIDCFRKMHVPIDLLPNNRVIVHGKGLHGLTAPSQVLNTGKSGTTFRFLLSMLAAQKFPAKIMRDYVAQKKPIVGIVKPLRKMGLKITGNTRENLYPLTVYPSPLNGTEHNLEWHETQMKSPIIISGLFAEGNTIINEPVKSRNHSELMLNYLGANLEINDLSVRVKAIKELYAQKLFIPGDISIAAFFVTAGLLVPNSELIIKDVGLNPTRTGFLDIYRRMGATIQIENERLVNNEKMGDIWAYHSELKSTTIKINEIPGLIDEIPVIIVAATKAQGTTVIEGLEHFKLIRSNRLSALIQELRKMGAKIDFDGNTISIEGREEDLDGTIVESYNDVSIAMALSVAGLFSKGETMVRKAQIVDIAFPEFLPVLSRL
jgi:3-phosphoshikimate 1-carboxyvinyltransferase